MIAKWIICGILCLVTAPSIAQISDQSSKLVDSLLDAMDTTTSNYRVAQIADELLQVIDTTKVSSTLYQAYLNKGLSYIRSGDHHKALPSLQTANHIAHELQDSFLIAESAYRVGIIQMHQELTEEARHQFETALSIFSDLDSLRWIAFVHNVYGTLEGKQENWEEALSYYTQAYDMLQELGLNENAGVALNNKGDAYLNMGNYNQAYQIFKESLTLARGENLTEDVAIAHLNMGLSLRGMKIFDSAVNTTRAGIEIARNGGFKRIENLGLKDQSETFEQTGAADSALTYLKAYLNLKDSLEKEESSRRLNELYVAYETQKAQNEIASRQREIESLQQKRKLNTLTSYLLISILIFGLALSTSLTLRNRMKRKLAESELQNQKLKSEQMRRELEAQQKDLTYLALDIARKNDLFTKTNETLSEIKQIKLPDQNRQKIRQLIRFNNQQLRINEDLQELQINIEKVNSGFYDRLSGVAPDLTQSEKQLCSLLRLKLSTKEIASIRNISPKSVEMARYRLRKKLPINAEDDIYEFVEGI